MSVPHVIHWDHLQMLCHQRCSPRGQGPTPVALTPAAPTFPKMMDWHVCTRPTGGPREPRPLNRPQRPMNDSDEEDDMPM